MWGFVLLAAVFAWFVIPDGETVQGQKPEPDEHEELKQILRQNNIRID